MTRWLGSTRAPKWAPLTIRSRRCSCVSTRRWRRWSSTYTTRRTVSGAATAPTAATAWSTGPTTYSPATETPSTRSTRPAKGTRNALLVQWMWVCPQNLANSILFLLLPSEIAKEFNNKIKFPKKIKLAIKLNFKFLLLQIWEKFQIILTRGLHSVG